MGISNKVSCPWPLAIALVLAVIFGGTVVTADDLPPATVYTKDHAPPTPKIEDLPLKESVSRFGITWTFEKPARVGQFVNGDWYVVGSVTVKMIDPKPLWGDEVKDVVGNKNEVTEGNVGGKYARNGSTLNLPAVAPRAKGGHGGTGVGFDSRIFLGRYDADQFTRLPIAMKPGDSLVSTISLPSQDLKKFDSHEPVLKTAAVLTCMPAPQPPDAFRPSFCETSTSKIYLARNLRRELLLTLPRPASAPKDLGGLVKKFERPWVDTVEFGFAAPKENMPDYGQEVCKECVEPASLALLLDYSPEEKETLLVNFVQAGIDLWGILRGGRSWPCLGGHHSGRKWPILFAGIMLNDKDLQSPAKLYPKTRFQEDDQTALCPVQYEGKTYDRCWTGAKVIFTGHSGLAGKGMYGPLELFPPTQWPGIQSGRLPSSEAYRRANTSNDWVGYALAARLMHAEKIWDHDAFFIYVDRWMTEDDAPQVEAIKKAGGPDMTKDPPRDFPRQGYAWCKLASEMWAKYRDNLPPAAEGHKVPPAEKTWK